MDKPTNSVHPSVTPVILQRGSCVLIKINDDSYVLIHCEKCPTEEYRCWIELFAPSDAEITTGTIESLKKLVEKVNGES